MNLLPFVMAIVMVLGMFSLSQFQRGQSIQKEKSSYVAYFKGLRIARNAKESSAYSAQKKSNSQGKNGAAGKAKNKATDTKTAPFFREKKVGWPSGKINLSTLLDTPPKYPKLEAIAASYLTALYGKHDIFPSGGASAFLKLLISELSRTELPLYELILEDPKMQRALYKLLRGTNTYAIDTHEGYPPFERFFTFEASSTSPVPFHSANEVLLSTLLGKDAEKLIAIEKEQLKGMSNTLNSPIKSAEKAKELLGKKFSDIAHLFHFQSGESGRHPETHVDAQTKITVRTE